MKKVFLAPVLAILLLPLLLIGTVAAWDNLNVSGLCQNNGSVTWTVSASQQEDDNLVQVSSDKDFTTVIDLTLDSKTLSATITNNWNQIFARWTNDHTVVTASAKVPCVTPTPHPKATPPMTNTLTLQVTTDNDVKSNAFITAFFITLFAFLTIAFVTYWYFEYRKNNRR